MDDYSTYRNNAAMTPNPNHNTEDAMSKYTIGDCPFCGHAAHGSGQCGTLVFYERGPNSPMGNGLCHCGMQPIQLAEMNAMPSPQGQLESIQKLLAEKTTENAEQAIRITQLLNEREQYRMALIFAKADLIAILLQSEGRDDYWWPSIDTAQKGIDAALAALAASEPSTPAKEPAK
jgi:hypothetical protein